MSDVLAFSRELRIDPEPIAVGELLERSLAGCVEVAERIGARIDVPDESAMALTLHCDASLVQQALSNVVRNGLEAMGESDGERAIEFAIALCHVRSARGRQAPMVSISVRDHGPGVSEDVMRRMFNPFFTTRHAGTGLGLAIVHRIVDAHEGRVTVRNHQEGGAVVELMLPAAGQEQQRSRAVAAGAHGGDV